MCAVAPQAFGHLVGRLALAVRKATVALVFPCEAVPLVVGARRDRPILVVRRVGRAALHRCVLLGSLLVGGLFLASPVLHDFLVLAHEILRWEGNGRGRNVFRKRGTGVARNHRKSMAALGVNHGEQEAINLFLKGSKGCTSAAWITSGVLEGTTANTARWGSYPNKERKNVPQDRQASDRVSPFPRKQIPTQARPCQELLRGKYGEMSTLNDYLFQSFNFRSKWCEESMGLLR